jgi:hypothetical protein
VTHKNRFLVFMLCIGLLISSCAGKFSGNVVGVTLETVFMVVTNITLRAYPDFKAEFVSVRNLAQKTLDTEKVAIEELGMSIINLVEAINNRMMIQPVNIVLVALKTGFGAIQFLLQQIFKLEGEFKVPNELKPVIQAVIDGINAGLVDRAVTLFTTERSLSKDGTETMMSKEEVVSNLKEWQKEWSSFRNRLDK